MGNYLASSKNPQSGYKFSNYNNLPVPSFKGEFEHSVDSKGRVAFPAKLRKALTPQANEQFTILRGIEPCLYLYPGDEWEKVEEKLSEISNFNRRGRTVKRNFLRYAEDLSLDKQNRIPIPSSLKEYAGIDGTAVFIGNGEMIEVWSPDKLEEIDSTLSSDDYGDMFEEVMSGKKQEED